jgi:hypothetical protein
VRPLTVLLGVVMGSAIALSVSLSMTAIVFLLLPEYAVRLSAERWPLLKGLLWSWSLMGVAAAGFIGELRERRWRRYPQVLLALMLAVLLWMYWP